MKITQPILCVFMILSSIALSGCVAGIIAAGGTAAYKHTAVKTLLDDETICYLIRKKLHEDMTILNSHLVPTCFNRVVLITGQAQTHDMRQRAMTIAQSIKGVAQLYNQVSIGKTTSISQRMADSITTTKVRASMLAAKGLSSSAIQTITENGNVYLMGIINQQQASLALKTVRQVSGVKKVVKVFSPPIKK